MRATWKVLVVAAGVAALWWAYVQVAGVDEVEYRGAKFKLTKKFVDYDAYKNDPNNLAESELPRIEKLMVEATIAREFKDWPAFVRAAFPLAFPGYGFGGGPEVRANGREFLVSSVEIPTRPAMDKNRYFVLEKLAGGNLKLVDDFVSSGFPTMAVVEFKDGRLIYRSKNGMIVRETTL
jgi:hypothetical protein